MDPELQGPDPVWDCVLSGKGHVYYSLAIIVILAVVMGGHVGAIIAALSAATFADLWAHQYLH
jgi:hypothetical protein